MKLIEITVSRQIAAPPEAVFDAWLDPKSPCSFLSAGDFAIVDGVEGGLFYWTTEHEGRECAYGRFLRLSPGTAIEHTWMSEDTGGRESVVSIKLAPNAGGTTFTLRHSGVPDTIGGHSLEVGWTYFSQRMADGVGSLLATTSSLERERLAS